LPDIGFDVVVAPAPVYCACTGIDSARPAAAAATTLATLLL
jgi:hypothetical protein